MGLRHGSLLANPDATKAASKMLSACVFAAASGIDTYAPAWQPFALSSCPGKSEMTGDPS